VDEEGKLSVSFTRLTQLAVLELDAEVPSSGPAFLLDCCFLEGLRLTIYDCGADPPSFPLLSDLPRAPGIFHQRGFAGEKNT